MMSNYSTPLDFSWRNVGNRLFGKTPLALSIAVSLALVLTNETLSAQLIDVQYSVVVSYLAPIAPDDDGTTATYEPTFRVRMVYDNGTATNSALNQILSGNGAAFSHTVTDVCPGGNAFIRFAGWDDDNVPLTINNVDDDRFPIGFPNSFTGLPQTAVLAITTFSGTSGVINQGPFVGADGGTYSLVITYSWAPAANSFSLLASNDGPYCLGQTVNLNTTVTAPGAVTYTWDGPNVVAANASSTTAPNAPVGINTYSVTASLANGCFVTASTDADVRQVPSLSASNNSPICENTTLGVSVVDANSVADTYSWDRNSWASDVNSLLSAALTDVGAYNVTATNSATGCSATATTNVTVDFMPSGTASNNSPLCVGQSLDISFSEGNSNSVDYFWSPNTATPATGNASNPTSNIASVALGDAGTYTVTLANPANATCSITLTTAVTVNDNPSLTASNNSPICENTTLGVSVVDANSVADTYSWDRNGWASDVNSLLSAALTDAGVYNVTASNAATGCSATATTNVTVDFMPVGNASNNSPLCVGQTLDISYLEDNGRLVDYSWSPNTVSPATGNDSNPTSNIASVALGDAGTYTVTLANPANAACSITLTTAVTVNDNPSMSLAFSSNPICEGQQVTLTATDANNLADTYTWVAPNQTIGNVSVTSFSTVLADAGNYDLTATNSATGCSATATTPLTVNATPTPVAASPGAHGAGIYCEGETIDLACTPNGATSFSWSGGSGTFNDATLQNPQVTGAASGVHTYIVIGTDGNGCTASTSVNVTVNANPTVTAVQTPDPIVCQRGTISVSATNTLGSGAIATYNWATTAGGGFAAAINTQSVLVTNNAQANNDGDYTVTITDVNGCTATDVEPVSVTIITPPSYTSAPICFGQVANLNAVTGGSNGTFTWYSANNYTSQVGTGASFNTAAVSFNPTNYWMSETDPITGCVSNLTAITLTPNAVPNAPAATGVTACEGSTANLTATVGAGETAEWFFDALGQNSMGTGLSVTTPVLVQNGVFYVRADNGLCKGPLTAVTVTVIAKPVLAISNDGPKCDGEIVGMVATGGGSYLWSNGDNTASSTATVSGTYTVTVTNVAGCASTISTVVVVRSNPTAGLSASAATICRGESVTLTATGGSSYAWSTGEASSSIVKSPTNNATYSVSVYNSFGCVAVTSTSVAVNALPVATISGPATFCQGETVTLSTAAGEPSYAWSNGATANTTDITSGGTFTVTVTAANACTATASYAVVMNNRPTVSITPQGPTTFCVGGSVVLRASGSIANYGWSTGDVGTNTITVTPVVGANIYTVTAESSQSCQTTASVTVTVNPLPVISFAGTQSINCSSPSTSISVTSVPATNAVVWSNGSTSSPTTFSNTLGAAAGSVSYTATVTDVNGCINSASLSITEDFVAPTADITPNRTLVNCTNPTASLDATTSNATYAWSTGAITASISVGTAGTYTVTITDTVNGCTSTDSQVITEDFVAPTVTIAGTTHINCNTPSTTVTASGADTYVWSTSATTSTEEFIQGEAGVYTVVGTTTANGCTASANVTITEDFVAPTVTIAGTTHINCNTPSTTVTASGADTYVWSTSANTSTEDFIQGEAGVYTVVGTTIANGCTASANVTITEDFVAPTVTIAGTTHINCNTPSTTVTASGADTYVWSTSATTSTEDFIQGEDGVFTVVGTTTANGCTASANVTITEDFVAPTVTIAGTTLINCNTPSTTVTASGADTYVWSTSAVTSTEDFIQGEAGVYTVVGTTTANGCTASANVTITEDFVAPTVTIAGTTHINCNTPSTTVTASGADTYVWSTSTTTSTEDFIQGEAGVYTVVGTTTANGCTASANVTITEDFVAPTVTIAGTTHINCNTPSTTVTASGADTYVWSTSASTSTEDFIQGEAGVYSVTGTALNGCTASANVTITEDFVAPTVVIAGTTHINCNTPSTTVTASGADTYVWSTSATTSTEDFIQGEAGVYTVVGTTTANGCTASANVTITEDFVAPTPVATAGGPTTFCNGGSVGLSVTGGVSYLWSNGDTNASTTVTATGNYTAVATAANGCTATSNAIAVINNPNPIVTINTGGPVTFCEGGISNLQANSNVSFASYQWNQPSANSALVFIDSRPGSPTRNAFVGTQSFIVTVTDNNTGCFTTASQVVTVFPTPSAVVTAAGPTTFCQGGSVDLSVPASASYLWSNGAATQTINVTTANTYTVTVTSADGCSATGSQQVLVEAIPVVIITPSGATSFCLGGSVNLAVSGSPGVNYNWSNGSISNNVTVNTSGNYSVTATSFNGCTAADSELVTVFVNPTVVITGTTHINCNTPSTMVTASGADTYVWSTSAATSTEDFIQGEAGVYTVVGTTTANGCTASANVTITEDFVAPTLTIAGTTHINCNTPSTTVTASGADTYVWSTSATTSTEDFIQGEAGVYTVVGTTTANGCTASANVTITEDFVAPTVTIAGTTLINCNTPSTTVTASGADTYVWSTSAATSTEDFIQGEAGVYTVVGTTTANGCTASANVTITEDFVAPTVTIAGTTHINCNTPSTTVTASGADTYVWSTSATTSTEDFIQGEAGVYTVVGTTTANGCTASANVTITEDFVAPTVTIAGTTHINCNTPSTTVTASGADTYVWSTSATTSTEDFIQGEAGVYTVVGTTTANGCTASANVTITEDFVAPTVTIAGTTHINCTTPSTTVTASGANTYVWSTSAATSTEDFIQGEAGVYTVVGTTTGNGCTASANVTITEDFVVPTVTFSGATHINCTTPSTTVTASGADTYVWSTSATTSTEDFIQGEAGVYSVVGTSTGNGCTASANVTITEDFIVPTVTFSGATHINCTTPSTTVTASGANTYVWSTSATTSTEDFVQGEAGVYTVSATGLNGCTSTANVTITEDFVAPTASIATGATVINCSAPTTTFTATGGVSYLWSDASTASTVTASQGNASYAVTVTAANGCTATASASVIEDFVVPTVVITPSGPTSFCFGGNVDLAASGAVSYVWSNGATTASINVSVTNNYTVTGTAANGCVDTDVEGVTVTPAPSATITAGGPVSFCEGGILNIQAATNASNPSYVWNAPFATSSLVLVDSRASSSTRNAIVGINTFIVTITDGTSGCTSTSSINIEVFPAPSAVITPNGPTTFCQGGSVTLDVPTGASYAWSNGATTSSINVSTTNTYIVSVTSINGCSATSSVAVQVNTVPTVTITPSGATTFCQGSQVTLTAAGSAANYAWSNGVSGINTIVVNASGLYSVTASNGLCESVASVSVTVHPAATATASVTDNVICFGESVTFTSTGGVSAAWNNGVADGVAVAPAASNAFNVTVTDINGCTATASVNVTVHANPTATATVTDDFICFGESVTFTSTGGVSAAWNNGVTEGVAVAPAASNTFSVTVTDINACTATTSVNVTVNSNPTATATVTDDVICFGESVTFTSTGGISAAWNNGVTEGVAIAPAASNTFNVTVTDINGCTATASVNVTVNANPIATATVTDDFICFGESVTFTSIGGVSAAWNNGVTEGVAIAPTASNAFNVTVTDINGCTATASVNVTVNANPTATATVTDDFICFGESVTFTSTGGVSAAWDNGVTEGVAIAPAASNAFNVTVTDINGCTATASVNVTVNANPIATATVTDDFICFGESVTFNSTGGLSAAWDNGVTEGVAIAPAASNTFNVTVTDINGCTATTSVNVTVNANPVIGLTVTDDFICLGESVTFTSTGGTPVWDNAVLDGVAFAPTATNTYGLTVTDINGCTATTSVNVTVNSNPTATATVTDDVICFGESVTFTSTGGVSAAWNNGVTEAVAIAPTASNTFNVTVTDINGCTATASVNVTVEPLPVITVSVTDNFICLGDSITLTSTGGTPVWDNGVVDGVIFTPTATNTYTVTITGANGCTVSASLGVTVNAVPSAGLAFSSNTICERGGVTISESVASANTNFTIANYTFSGPRFATSVSGTNSSVAFGNAAGSNTGTYTVSITDVNGCTSSSSAVLTVNVVTPPVVTNTSAPCFGTATTLSATAGGNVSWYTNFSSALVYTGAIGQGNTFTTAPLNTNPVIYYAAADSAGCSSNMTTFTIVPLPIPSAPTATNVTICEGSAATLSCTVSAGNTSEWFSDALGQVSLGVAPTVNTGILTQDAVYYVRAISANGCNSSLVSVMVTVNRLPVVIATASDMSICLGDSTRLTSSGGTPVWDNGAIEGGFVSPTTSTIYSVTVTNAAGCTATAGVLIDVNSAPTLTAGVSAATVCAGTSVNVSVTGNATSYVWDNGLTTPNFSATPATTTTYTVTGTNIFGCAGTASVIVNVNPLPSVQAITSAASICVGDSTTLDANGAASYVWSNAATTAQTGFRATVAGNFAFDVTGTDANGCSNTSSVSVEVRPLPTITAAAQPAAVCVGQSSVLQASGGVSYVWGNAAGNFALVTVAPVTTTAYVVTATAANGCTNTASVTVTLNLSPTVTIAPDTAICLGGTAVLTASGATSFVWSNGASTASVSVSPRTNTTYTVIGTDANGCTASDATAVTVNALPVINTTALPASICVGDSTTVAATGAVTYVWSPNGTGASFRAAPASNTNFTVTGTDALGCSATSAVLVEVRSLPTPQVTALPAAVCPGGGSVLNVVGGAAFAWSTGSVFNIVPVSPTATTTYIVTVTGFNGCSTTASTTVTVNAAPAVTVTNLAGATAQCEGDTLRLVATNTGAAINNYAWSTPARNVNVNNDTLTIANINKQDNQGFYDLVVTDANGCTASTFALVNVVGAIPTSLVATNLTGPACPGANFRLTADRTSDPVAATNYAWSGPNSFTAATRDAIVTAATSAANGIYTVTVSRGTCPAVTATTEVEVYPAPALAVTPASATITQGETLQLEATGAATYRWDFPADVAIYAGNINISNPLVISNVPATYVITVTGYSQNSCAAKATMSLIVEPSTELESGNIITPEEVDGFNDLLEIAYLNNLTQGYSLSIIDRGGNELKTYENNFTSWDGRIDGQLVPAGTYWWIVKTTDNKVFRGVFTVIR